MANEKLVAEARKALRQAVRSYGIKGASKEAIARGFHKLTYRRPWQESHRALASLVVATDTMSRAPSGFTPVPVREQIANHAKWIKEMTEKIRAAAMRSEGIQ